MSVSKSSTGPIPSGRGILMPRLPGSGKSYVSYADVMDSITDGGFTAPQLTLIKRECQRALTTQRKVGMIMAGATVRVGDRVRINENYHYKSMIGVTGTAAQVTDHYTPGSKNVWVSVKLVPDALPKRVPKYGIDSDGKVHVAGHCVELLPGV